jgi:hypothetical protein
MTPNPHEQIDLGGQAEALTIQRLPSSSTPTDPSLGSPQAQPTQSFNYPPVQTGSISRSTFDSIMSGNFGVNRVFNGTRTDQENYLRSSSGDSTISFNPPGYTEWNPGAASEVYAHIVNAFRSFAEIFGGIPPVNEIGFFILRYAYNRSSASVVMEGNVPAAYGANTLLIYSPIITLRKELPTERSTTGPAATPTPTREQSISRIITHELGHGLVEVGLTTTGSGSSAGAAPDAQLMNDYKRAVGWTSGSSTRLYDMGVPEVSEAIVAGRVPDARYQITTANWNQQGWVEQPISAYMTSHPSEDLPESVMAYINEPTLLQSRSPRRFQFMQQRALLLGPYFRQITDPLQQPGDFPIMPGNQALG